MVRIIEFAPSAAFYLLALAAQVSGYTNSAVAAILAGVATLLLLVPVGHRWWCKQVGRRVESWHLQVIGLGGVIVFAIIALSGVIWQHSVNPAADLQIKFDALQSKYDKFVKPRELTDAQIKAVSDFLLPRSHHTIRIFFAKTDEANAYAGQIMQAFKLADWDLPDKGIVPLDSRPDLPDIEGVGFYAALPAGAVKRSSGKAYDLAMEGLAKAQITFRGGGSVRSETDSEYVVVVVGRKETR